MKEWRREAVASGPWSAMAVSWVTVLALAATALGASIARKSINHIINLNYYQQNKSGSGANVKFNGHVVLNLVVLLYFSPLFVM